MPEVHHGNNVTRLQKKYGSAVMLVCRVCGDRGHCTEEMHATLQKLLITRMKVIEKLTV